MQKGELLFAFLLVSSGLLSVLDGTIGFFDGLPWTNIILRLIMGVSSLALVAIYTFLQKNLDLLIFFVISFGINMIATLASVINIFSTAEAIYHQLHPINYNLNVIATGLSGMAYFMVVFLGSYLSQEKKKN